MAKIVSKVYGDALFELALEKQSVDVLYEEAKALREIFKNNGELMQLLNHPKISKEEKNAAVKAIFDGRVSDDMAGFLVLVVDKGRADELNAVLGYFFKAFFLPSARISSTSASAACTFASYSALNAIASSFSFAAESRSD